MPSKVAFALVPGLSRSRVDRAGVTLRRWWLEDKPITDAEVEAFMAMIRFREAFQMPLNKTVMGLRSMVRSECPEFKQKGARIPVVQRLKRRGQIINKLVRFPETKLSNMGDIGGCRAVLSDRNRVDGLLQHIRRSWQVHGKVRDTRDEPAESGYRAVHVIVVRDGRRIEIQLRDPREHEWAVAVERAGARLGIGLKEGEGPDDLKEYFRLASLGMYLDSVGDRPDSTFLEKFRASRGRIRHYFMD